MAMVKKPKVMVWTPPGMVSFPFFAAPDVGRQYSDNKYKADLLIPKAMFKEKGKPLQEAVLSVGKSYFGEKFKIKDGVWQTPFKDTDKNEKITHEKMKNCILIRAKAGFNKDKQQAYKPVFMGPRKNAQGQFPELTQEEIMAIKGGDWCLFYVAVYPYDPTKDAPAGGVTLGLNAVQFWKADEGFGQGKSVVFGTASELEVDKLDDVSETKVAESEDDSVV
jgi:hypothetical protein